MKPDSRGVSSVISTILMVAIVVILIATVSASFFGLLDELSQPTPNVAETAGEFVAGGDRDEQVVQITHVAGDSVVIEGTEIIVGVSGDSVDVEAPLVSLLRTFSSG